MKYNYKTYTEYKQIEYNKTENPLFPYEYPKSCVRYLNDVEFKRWLKGVEIV